MERELSNRSSGPAEAANEAVPGDSASVTHTAEPSQQSGQTPESGHVWFQFRLLLVSVQ